MRENIYREAHMKRFLLLCMAIFVAFSVACTKAGANEIINTDKQSASAPVRKSASGHKERAEHNYPPMVKVAGVVYVDTGYENAMATCGTADGEIKTAVDGTKMPVGDDESNFGTGYDYQLWEKGYMNVRLNNRWILFKDLNLKNDGNGIPEWVAHFTAKVIKAEEDSLLVEVTDVDDGFYFKERMTKPVSLSIENLDHGKDGFVSTDGLEGKAVEVYFGGEIRNTEPESSVPIHLEPIYKIHVKEGYGMK